MKTAYELAMERLSKTGSAPKTTPEQRARLAELDSKYAAKIAELEIALQDQIAKTAATGDDEKAGELSRRLSDQRKSLQAELEEKKEKVRQAKK